MSSNSYDASQNTLSPIAGTPKSQLNEAIAKAEASLKNQAKHIEAGNVATVAHSVGDFIIYGSSKQFAKVTQAIAVGSSIADGVNVDNTTEGEVLTTLNNDLSDHTVLTKTDSTQPTVGTTDSAKATVNVTKGLWLLEGRVQGINAITNNSQRNECFFKGSGNTRYGLGQITLPHNSPYPVASFTSIEYFSSATSVGIGFYMDAGGYKVNSISMKATKIMDL